MSEKDAETLLVLTFQSKDAARDALGTFKRLEGEDVLKVDDAVFIDKDDAGDARVTETVDAGPKEGAVHTGLWGAMIGTFVAGPVGTLVGGAVSAGVGALAARLIDIGIPDKKVKELEEALTPGNTLLALLLSKVDSDRLESELQQLAGAKLMESTLSEETVNRLHGALGRDQGD